MTSASGSIILARDFDTDTTSVTRDRWDGGKLRAVLAVLPEGARVHLVTEAMTGHMVMDVELIDVLGPGFTGNHDRLLVRYHHSDGTHHDTAHSSINLGPIVVSGDSRNAKWDALHFWHVETSKALDVLRPHAEALGQNYGRYRLRLTRQGVYATYEPQRPEAGPKGYGEVIDGKVVRWSTYGGYVGPHGSYRDLARN